MIIYAYEDRWENDRVVYIGKDKSKDNRRHREHLNSKKPTKFERILQKQPDRYRYKPLLEVLDADWYDDIEGIMIWVLKKLNCADHNIINELDPRIKIALEE